MFYEMLTKQPISTGDENFHERKITKEKAQIVVIEEGPYGAPLCFYHLLTGRDSFLIHLCDILLQVINQFFHISIAGGFQKDIVQFFSIGVY